MNGLGRSAVLKSLKSFTENGLWEVPDFGKVIAEESDRGCVIILVSILDDVLAAALEQRMREDMNSDQRERLFGFDAPLGSFSARIKMAYALEVIDREIRDDLDMMRAMRNACAHARRDIGFSDDPLRHALSLLFASEEWQTHIQAEDRPELCKLHFVAVTRYAMARIQGETQADAEAKANHVYDMLFAEVARQYGNDWASKAAD